MNLFIFSNSKEIQKNSIEKAILQEKIVLTLHQRILVGNFFPPYSLHTKEDHFAPMSATNMLLFS